MEGRNAPVELPATNGLKIKKNDEKETNSYTRQDCSDVSMPICFLVKEQAKSLVAIQDLKKRVENIENIQDDVIDSLAQIKKFLSSESKTFSDINLSSSSLNHTPSHTSCLCAPGYDSFSKSNKYAYSPSILKGNITSLKDCDPLKVSCNIKFQEHSEKQFELKGKESALESDKQDSGLDSDCREVHDNPSLNKHSVIWTKQESGDELLQLLEEISQRTEFLQKQLAVIDQSSCLDEVQSTVIQTNNFKLAKAKSPIESDASVKKSVVHLTCSKANPSFSTSEEIMSKTINDQSCEHFESKSLSRCMLKDHKRCNKIDSAMVSSILKETSIVDLQRQVLIYLVENAVLQTKLSELEHLLSFKTLECNKIENSLKDEARLLMMENRELRIGLDEQKLEINSLKSKILMLEKLLKSISIENRELSLHVSESLGGSNLPKKDSHKFSSFTFGNSGPSKVTRRSSLPTQVFCQNETNFNCVKSKLLSNASSFLDVTEEEPEQREQWPAVETLAGTYKNHSKPVQSSTPINNTTKLKDIKAGIACPPFQTGKKRFKQTEKDGPPLVKTHYIEKHVDIPQDSCSEACVKSTKLYSDDSAVKFPFNSILEKLKTNSDYRLSKRTSLAQAAEVNFSGDCEKSFSSRKKFPATEELEASSSDTNLRQNCQSKNFQYKRGKNIHQRIQDILDRIMSESEEMA